MVKIRLLKKILTNLGISLLSFLILFVLLELGFRLTEKLSAPEDPSQIWAIYDRDLGYRLRPNFADFNEYGLRDDPIDSRKTKFRLLLLGDSVPFYGDNLDDTYPGRLETIINNDSQLVATEVINAGIKGYTTYQELLYLKKYGLAFNPDLVCISFVLNDLHKFLHQFVVENGEIVGENYVFSETAVQTVKNPLYQLARKSHFLVWLRHQLSIFDTLIEFKTSNGFTFDYRPDFNTAWKDKPWEYINTYFSEFGKLSNEHDFKVFVVVFPFGEQLREEYLERDYEYVTKPQRKLKKICAEFDIPLLDLLNEIDPETHLLEDQIHLTRQGRQIAAHKIAQFLKTKQLIPTNSNINSMTSHHQQ
ncbi:MAG: hypothetical protein GWN01_16335 [Nitrosopumilaceae archaeon]|nr:SGNH/GDSL hydrolase family protein [Nitrosopumilaceae archaeon]NIX63005.1 hypothetical protein [Nitrosopumilaceae archaeon]